MRSLLPVLALVLALLLAAPGLGLCEGAAVGAGDGEPPGAGPEVPPPPPPPQHRPRLAHLGNLISQLEDAATAAPPQATSPTHALPSAPPPLRPQHFPLRSHHLQDVEHDSSDYYEDEEDDEDDDYDFDEEYGDVDADVDGVHVDDILAPPWELPQGHQPRGMSPVSQTKWDTMGTRSGVDELRRSRIGASKTLAPMPGYTEAVDHLLRVNRDGDCKVPKPRVVQVKHEYPHPSKIYLPRCTILHQCGDDTGCCNAESLTCVPRQSHRVDLFFYTTTMGSGPNSLQRVERLSFYNHTECGCMDRNSEMSRDRAQALRKSSRGLFQAPFQPRAERAPQPFTSCRCPSKYAVRPTSDGACLCDCFDKHRECLRLKKGKEYFSTHDRQCIQKSECKVPACEFGSYLRLAGRCPKKRERFEAWNQ